MNAVTNTRIRNLAMFTLFGVILVEVVYIWIGGQRGLTHDQQIASAVRHTVETCKEEVYHPACYDREIPKLMERFTMEDVFGITKSIQAMDPSYSYCHVLGHALSSRETKKDPSKWKEVITRCPSGVCSNGCVHGAFQERFRTDILSEAQIVEVKPQLADVCEPRGAWSPTGMEQATCYHAMGHLLMYITGANINRSLALCDELSGPKEGRQYDFHRVCYDGVFMQMYQPLEPEDIALVKGKQPTRQTVAAFCGQYNGEAKVSCVTESWPLFMTELENPKFTETFCGQLPVGLRTRCYTGIFYILVVQNRFDLAKTRAYCDKLTRDAANICYASTASRLIETDWGNISKATDWCNGISSESGKQACFDELLVYASYNFHAGSSEFFALCNGLPDPWKTSCLEGEKKSDGRPVSQ